MPSVTGVGCVKDTGGDNDVRDIGHVKDTVGDGTVTGVGCVNDIEGDGDVTGVGRAKETSSVRCRLLRMSECCSVDPELQLEYRQQTDVTQGKVCLA